MSSIIEILTYEELLLRKEKLEKQLNKINIEIQNRTTIQENDILKIPEENNINESKKKIKIKIKKKEEV